MYSCILLLELPNPPWPHGGEGNRPSWQEKKHLCWRGKESPSILGKVWKLRRKVMWRLELPRLSKRSGETKGWMSSRAKQVSLGAQQCTLPNILRRQCQRLADHNTHLFLWPAISATPWFQKVEVSAKSAVREGLASIFSVVMWLQREQKLCFSRTCWTGHRILSSLEF